MNDRPPKTYIKLLVVLLVTLSSRKVGYKSCCKVCEASGW